MPLEARSAEKGEAGGGGAQGGAEGSTGTGTLRIHVLDEETRAPIPDLQFVAYRERGGVKELGRGRTDKDGRAELREVEANTVIVRTERRPPHAEQTGAVWLTNGATKELEILVGAGGAFVGRVIDDLERPIEGAEIRIQGQREPGPPDSLSGPDGRFRVGCLASRPGSVWIVDGAMRPEGWGEVYLSASRDNMSTGGRGTPLPGKDVDLGDLRLYRATTYTGRLFDAGGRLVAGALLSQAWGPAHGPADPQFQLAPGEVLTDGGGSFELRAEPGLGRLLVWTREGANQHLKLPEGKPGERVDGIELRLLPETLFELELVDASGGPAVLPAPAGASERVLTPWARMTSWGSEKLSVLARSADGARERIGCEHADPDGKWRGRLAIDPRAIGELEVTAPGYAPAVETSESGFPALVQRKLVLTPFPTLRVRLVPKDPDAKPLDGEGGFVTVQVCMADPVRHAAARNGCCGLGSSWYDRWRGVPLEIVMPVRKQAPFWIYARGPRPDAGPKGFAGFGYTGEQMPSGGLVDFARIGPFEPGPEVHELALDPRDFMRGTAPEKERKPPPPSQPGEDRRGRLRAHVSDARTGKPIRAYIYVEGGGASTDENGDVKDQPVQAGKGKIDVQSRGYRILDLGERTVPQGETLDLGSIALEPLTRHRGRILDADGNALPRVWLGVVAGVADAQNENGGLGSEPDGSFELIGELPQSFVLQVLSPAMHAGWGAQAQRFALASWPEDEVKELRLREVPEGRRDRRGCRPAGSLARSQRLPCTWRADRDLRPQAGKRSPARGALPGPRDRFVGGWAAFRVPARPRALPDFWGANLMHELPVTELEVTPGDTDIELAITAH